MELKEFINNTLTQIANGIQSAIENADGKGYMVNPEYDRKTKKVYSIKFDLTVESGKAGSTNIKVLSGGVTEKSMNHISFEVDMTLPGTPTNTSPKRPSF